MEKQLAMRVSWVTLIVNILLAVFKFLAGILASSSAMISDAVHSASDVFSTIIVMIGVNLADKDSDDCHPYGHEKLESVASVTLAVILAITGLGIGLSGIEMLLGTSEIKTPGTLALVAAVVSIVVKEWMFHYTKRVANKIHSDVLMADAWHHRSDALSSVGSFVGIFGARMGILVLEPIASILICVLVVKAAVQIFREAADKMVDHSCDQKTILAMREKILSQEGVLEVDDIKTRIFGNKIYVDIEIAALESMPLIQAHEIAQNVHDAIETFPGVKHCMVHVNPHSGHQAPPDGDDLANPQ